MDAVKKGVHPVAKYDKSKRLELVELLEYVSIARVIFDWRALPKPFRYKFVFPAAPSATAYE